MICVIVDCRPFGTLDASWYPKAKYIYFAGVPINRFSFYKENFFLNFLRDMGGMDS